MAKYQNIKDSIVTPEEVTPLIAQVSLHQTSLAEANQKIQKLPKIKTMADYQLATDVAKLASMRIKNATTALNFFIEPKKNEVKEIKALFDTIISPAEDLLAGVKDSMKTFMIAEQAKADEKQRLIEAKALKNAKPTDSTVSVPVVNDIKTQHGNLGSSTMRKLKKWRLTDVTMVPLQYLMLNEVEINKAMRQGVHIDGIEYYEDVTAVIR